jgi:hypothetical protein
MFHWECFIPAPLPKNTTVARQSGQAISMRLADVSLGVLHPGAFAQEYNCIIFSG